MSADDLPMLEPQDANGAPAVVVRRWTGRVPASLGAGYLRRMRVHALPDYRRTPGNLGACCLHRVVGDVVEVTFLSWWRDYAAIEAFAGADISVAKYYDFDPAFLLEMAPEVEHHEAFGQIDWRGG